MKSASFTLEHVEPRTLFSVVAPGLGATWPTATAAIMVAAATVKSPLAAAFNVSGTFTKPLGNPDSGAHYHFTGSGKTTSLGKFTLAGDVSGPGFVANGHASGTLTITNAKGTLTLRVQGPPQAPGSLPSSVSFSITKGTGSYAHAAGKGTITLSASGTTHKFLFRFNPSK